MLLAGAARCSSIANKMRRRRAAGSRGWIKSRWPLCEGGREITHGRPQGGAKAQPQKRIGSFMEG